MEILWIDRAILESIRHSCDKNKQDTNICDTILIRKFIEQNGILRARKMVSNLSADKDKRLNQYKMQHKKMQEIFDNFQLDDAKFMSKKWHIDFMDYFRNTYKRAERIDSKHWRFVSKFGCILSQNGKLLLDMKKCDVKTKIRYCSWCESCVKKPRKCRGCCVAYYCDRTCQKKDWLLRHKATCYHTRVLQGLPC